MSIRSNTAGKKTKKAGKPVIEELINESRPALGAVIFFSLGVNLLTLTVPIFLLQVYDRVLPSQSLDSLWVLATIAAIALLAMSGLEASRRATLAKIGSWAEHRVGKDLLQSAVLRAVRRGEPSVSILNDANRIGRFISSSTLISILDAPWSPIFLLVIFLLHPMLGLVVSCGCVLLLALGYLHERLAHKDAHTVERSSRECHEMANRYVQNSEAIHAMGMHVAVSDRWSNANDQVLIENNRTDVLSGRFQSAARLTRLLLQILLIGTAAVLILNGELSAGAIIASVLLMRRAIAPLEQCIQSWKSLVEARSALRRVTEYLDHAPSLQPARPMPRPVGGLKAEGLSYRFKGASQALFSRVELIVKQGESIAIVGPTGSGKSTLLRILVGAKKLSSGRVMLGGNDMSQWDPAQLGPHIGYLPQDVELFPGSIRENVSRMQNSSIKSVVRAAQIAGVHHFIQNLPEGYETQIGVGGNKLSGGQRQRIALARAVFGGPRLVVLDEPDASLDREGVVALIQAISFLQQLGSTVIMVTHEIALRRFVDNTYELREGRLKKLEDVLSKKRATRVRQVTGVRETSTL